MSRRGVPWAAKKRRQACTTKPPRATTCPHRRSDLYQEHAETRQTHCWTLPLSDPASQTPILTLGSSYWYHSTLTLGKPRGANLAASLLGTSSNFKTMGHLNLCCTS